MRSLILYGVGSPYVVDLEEVCRRCGVEVIAYVANVEGPVFASDPARVIRPDQLLPVHSDEAVIIPMLTPGFRYRAAGELDALGLRNRPCLVDPTAVVAASARIGEGVTVNAASVIGGAVTLEAYVLVNRSASIGHHSYIEAFATVGPGAVIAGSVRVGRGAFIGAGAVLLPKVEIGPNAVVGGGAVVTRNVPAHAVVAGNPARILRTHVEGYGDVGVP